MYYSGYEIKSMRWPDRVAHIEEGRGAYKALVVKLEGKSQIGRPRIRWDEHIQKVFQ